MAPPVVYRMTATPMVPRSRVITDVSAFFGITNSDIIAIGEEAKAGELYNLLSTLVGDEPFLPTYGCDLPKRVFQPINAKLQQEMILDVFMASRVWLPDITIVTSQCYTIALPGNRVAGVVVGYQFQGVLWNLPVHLVEIGNP